MRVSVIIPVRNACGHLSACLEQLRHQDYPHHLIEIIVVDGASDDSTREVAKAFVRGDFSDYRILCLTETGRSQGLNAGIKGARGDAICRLDVRTRIPPDYISRCTDALLSTGAANVGGLQLPDGHSPVQQAIGMAMSHPFGVGNAKFRIGKTSGFVDTVYLGFFRRNIFDQVGYFDETATVISEDSDMNQRIRESGEKVYLDVNIHCFYVPRESLVEQFQLYYRYGGARAANVQKHRRFTSVRQMAAPCLIAGLAICAVVAPFHYFGRAGLALLGGTYAVADTAISLRLSLSKGKVFLLWPLMAAFPIMHFAWGFGFWRKLLVPENPRRQWKG